jgi:hypothetical protein
MGARYVVIDGFAMILAGFARATAGIDLPIDTSLDNEALTRSVESHRPGLAIFR